jgi:hypothetical protein
VAGAAESDVGELTVKVAVTTGLARTFGALKVMEQLWEPGLVRVAVLTEAVMLAGVTLAPCRASHAQSAPSAVVKLTPLAGFALLTAIGCEDGGLPPIT